MSAHDPAAPQGNGSRHPANAPAERLDLDARIEQLEQRLIAREAWVRSTARSLGQRAQHAVTPTPWLLPLVGGAAVLWLGWRWWRRPKPAPPAIAAPPVEAPLHRADGLAALPWAGLVALAWPLLPIAWRSRFSPAAATAAVSTGLLIVRRLIGRRAR